MWDYIKEMGFFKMTMMMIGAAVVDVIFIALLWIVPQGDKMTDITQEMIEKIKEIDSKYSEPKDYSFTDEKNDGACLYQEE